LFIINNCFFKYIYQGSLFKKAALFGFFLPFPIAQNEEVKKWI